jgi:hypothetical protein
MSTLPLLLKAAAVLQLGIALVNLFLVRLLNWRGELARVPLLLREVFQVHLWFISITLAIFGAMSWRFAAEIGAGTDLALRWMSAGVGFFWAIRTVLQVTYYSSSHWRGQPARLLVHVLVLFLYGGFASVYLSSAFGRPAGSSLP